MGQPIPLVSVLMATYNNAAFIGQAVESVLAQSHEDFELIVSDNASTDSTEAIMRHYAALDKRVKYFRNSYNVGLAGNFNLCYQRAHAESRYFIGLPSDDWWAPQLLSHLLAVAEHHPEVTIIYSDIYRTDKRGRILNTYSDMVTGTLPPVGQHRAVRELYRANYIPFQTALVNRAQFRQLSPYDLPYAEDIPYTNDYFLWLSLMTRGAHAYYLPEPLAYFRKHDGAVTMPAKLIPRLEQEVQGFDKLAPHCPPELEPDRLRALTDRLAMLGFQLLHTRRYREARAVIQRAKALSPYVRLDLVVANIIVSLPLPGELRSHLWHLARGASQLFRKV